MTINYSFEQESSSTSLKKKSSNRKKILLGIAIFIVIAAIALGVGLGVGLRKKKTSPLQPASPLPPIDPAAYYLRIDCYPEAVWGNETVTEEMCERRGCKYDPAPDSTTVPVCFISEDSPLGSGYTIWADTTDLSGIRTMILLSKSSSSTSKRSRKRRSVLDQPLEKTDAKLTIEYGGENILHFKFSPDTGEERYEVPDEIVHINLPQLRPGVQPNYILNITNNDPFSFQIIRRSTQTVLWDTDVGGIVLSDQFLSISSRLPSSNVYGFGENTHPSFKHDLNFRTWPLFARDQWVGQGPQNNYGVHPFYTCVEYDGNTHGVLLLNSNAMDYSFTPLPMLTYRTIGGVLDFYVILGSSPETVIQQYTGLIGRPYMPPYWALGFQLCRYGYRTIEKMQDAVNRTLSAGIPQDVQYADIDHMNNSMDFTVDDVNFHGLREYFQELQNNGMHTIIILDPCLITNVSDYKPFKLGLTEDIFIKWPNRTIMPSNDYDVTNTTSMLGYVWPQGQVVFPDFFLPQTSLVWNELIVEHHQNILPFDGLWIDMNEPANFGTNDERPFNWPEDALPYWTLKCPVSPLDDPPYRTMAAYVYDADVKAADSSRVGGRLSDKTLCMIATQGPNGMYRHYDVHSLYGASQILPTLNAVRNATGERSIIVGRSTFPGSGSHMGHWLGDNFSDWKHLRDSIIGILEFNLFGFPYIGADICGFFGDTTPQLCKRWMQLGAFYPYSRNHNQIDSLIDQDPANFNDEVTHLSREALLIRYQLLPYLYTLFHFAHTRGSTVVRPLHHEFPKDNETWSIDEEFLWGDALLIVPILYENQTLLDFYLPSGRWFDFYTNETMKKEKETEGSWHQRNVSSDSSIPLFIRAGFILPTQEPANNTRFSRTKPFHILSYLDSNENANGQLFWDDGVSIDTYENNNYYFALFQCTQGEFSMMIQNNEMKNDEMNSSFVESVEIVGILSKPCQILINGEIDSNISFTFDDDLQRLVVSNLTWSMSSNLIIEWRSSPLATEEEVLRIDCMPEGGNKSDCVLKGCLWNASQSEGVPPCYLDRYMQ